MDLPGLVYNIFPCTADATRPIPVIYQSGYLTIKDFNPEFNIYTLGFPNDEVKYGFLNFIAPFYTEVPATRNH